MCDDRHRHQEWLKFLRVIDDLTPTEKQLHLIADNYATHKHPKVQRWLARHPRFHVHFTPTRLEPERLGRSGRHSRGTEYYTFFDGVWASLPLGR
jgi:hypothetical protein